MGDENLNVDSGAAPVPQEPVSKSIDDPTIKLLSELGGKVELVEKELRGLQSRQDKETNAFRERMAEYDKLIKKGYEPDEAIAELDNREKQSTVLQDLQKQVADLAKRVSGNGIAENVSQEVVKAFEDFKLDTKDPRVILAMQKQFASPDEAVLAAYKLSKQLSSTPSPTPQQAPSPVGGSGSSTDTEVLISRLAEYQKFPSMHKAEISSITAELDKRGWK